MIKHFDIVVLKSNPGFSTINRTGWKCIVIERFGEKGNFLSVTDKLGVSWPLVETDVEKVGEL